MIIGGGLMMGGGSSCFLNPSDKYSTVTLSNGNLTATSADTVTLGTVRANKSANSGKFYFEAKLTANPNGANWAAGIGTASMGLANLPGADAYGSSMFSAGTVWSDGAPHGSGFPTSNTVGDVLGVAVDFAAGNLWLAVNGTWIVSGNPATGANPSFTGVSGTFFPAVSVFNGTTVNTAFAPAFWKYACPAGFNPWP